MTKEEFIKFVESWDWTFAKTYAKKSPHEYIVFVRRTTRDGQNLSVRGSS